MYCNDYVMKGRTVKYKVFVMILSGFDFRDTNHLDKGFETNQESTVEPQFTGQF